MGPEEAEGAKVAWSPKPKPSGGMKPELGWSSRISSLLTSRGDEILMLVEEADMAESSPRLEQELSFPSFFSPPRWPAALPPRIASCNLGGIGRVGLLYDFRPALGLGLGRRRTAGVSGKAFVLPELNQKR